MLGILADECVDVQLVFRLRRLGYEVHTVREFCYHKGGDGVADPAVLEFAKEHRFAVLTTNESDFVNLHHTSPGHYGILIIETEADPVAQARRLHDELKRQGDVRGRIIWLTVAATKKPRPKRRKSRGG